MKQVFLFVLIYVISFTSFAQLQPKDFLSVHFGAETKAYAAEVNMVSGKNFTCRFLHSQSVYGFKDLQSRTQLPDGRATQFGFSATVEKAVGGKYKQGTIARLNIYRPDYSREMSFAEIKALNAGSTPIAVKFDDGKAYVGTFNGVDDLDIIQIEFVHTQSLYQFDQNGVIVKSGGIYKSGKKASFHSLKILSHSDFNL